MFYNTAIESAGVECVGCFACYDTCPTNAITMRLSREGFYIPVVDPNACTKCYDCAKACPIASFNNGDSNHSAERLRVYAAWSTDNVIRVNSSSGGIFSELAHNTISRHGLVVGCKWGCELIPEHAIACDIAGIVAMRGSKYLPSRLSGIYKQLFEALEGGISEVLFSGTPCQIAAARVYFGQRMLSRVLLVEVVCHGVASLLAFQRYLEGLFNGRKVLEYCFRDKTYGWVSIKAQSEDGQVYSVPGYYDPFYNGYVGQKLYLKRSCYMCRFQGIPRVADITLGDFWNVPKHLYDKRGVSLVSVNSKRGQDAFNALRKSGRIMAYETSLLRAGWKTPRLVYGNMRMPKARTAFLSDIESGQPFDFAIKRYSSTGMRQVVRRALDRLERNWRVLWLSFRELAFLRR